MDGSFIGIKAEPSSSQMQLLPEAVPVTAMETSEDFDELTQDSDYGDDEAYDDPSGFSIRGILEEPKYVSRTTEDLHALVHEGEIDLSPPYQRDVVWPESKQSALIDSLFRNYYVPPILLLHTVQEEGDPIQVCMDGKQRLTSIQKFFDGQIPLIDSRTRKKWWYTVSKTQSKNKNVIPDKFKRAFAEKRIQCVEYRKMSSTTERDIFQRVQMGVTLTAAEKLQAISAPWPDWIHSINRRYVLSDDESDNGLMDILEWDTKRGRSFQCVAQIIYCCDQRDSGVTGPEPTAQKLEKWLSRVDKPGDEFKRKIRKVMEIYWSLASDKTHGYTEPFVKIKKRLAPIEFVFIGVLLYEMLDDHDLGGMDEDEDSPSRIIRFQNKAKAALGLRQAIRGHHTDVRMNSRCMATAWEFIENLETDYQVGVNGVNGKKRKRYEEDGDNEYRPTPVTQLGPAPKTRGRPKKA